MCDLVDQRCVHWRIRNFVDDCCLRQHCVGWMLRCIGESLAQQSVWRANTVWQVCSRFASHVNGVLSVDQSCGMDGQQLVSDFTCWFRRMLRRCDSILSLDFGQRFRLQPSDRCGLRFGSVGCHGNQNRQSSRQLE